MHAFLFLSIGLLFVLTSALYLPSTSDTLPLSQTNSSASIADTELAAAAITLNSILPNSNTPSLSAEIATCVNTNDHPTWKGPLDFIDLAGCTQATFQLERAKRIDLFIDDTQAFYARGTPGGPSYRRQELPIGRYQDNCAVVIIMSEQLNDTALPTGRNTYQRVSDRPKHVKSTWRPMFTDMGRMITDCVARNQQPAWSTVVGDQPGQDDSIAVLVAPLDSAFMKAWWRPSPDLKASGRNSSGSLMFIGNESVDTA